MGSQKISNLGSPGTDLTAAVNKGYVDDAVSSFDQMEDLRNINFNRPISGDILVNTGLKKIFVTPPAPNQFTVETGGNPTVFEDQSGNKFGTIVDIQETTDEILGTAPNYNVTVITYEPTTGSFNNGETVIAGLNSAVIVDGPIDEVVNARESTASVINVTVTRTPGIYEDSLTDATGVIDFQIENDSIVNADVNSTANIAQSKLLMNRAGVVSSSSTLLEATSGDGTGQGSRGLAAFDDANFTEEVQLTVGSITALAGDIIRQGTKSGVVVTSVTNSTTILLKTSDTFVADSTVLTRATFVNGVEQAPTSTSTNVSSVKRSGYIGLKERTITFDKLAPIPTDTVLGRKTNLTGDVEAVPFADIVDQGFAVQDKDFENSVITATSGQILTFATNLGDPTPIDDGVTVTQAVSGATGTVQGKVFSEDKVVVVLDQGSANFTNTGDVLINSVNVGTPTSAPAATLTGSVMVKVAEGIYGTTPISTGSANNSIARRTTTGSIQATSFIIGGSATQEVLSENNNVLSLKTPLQGTILQASGTGSPNVQIPGSLNVGSETYGDPAVVNSTQGNAQSNVAGLTGKGFVSTPWLYSNFVEAIDTKGGQNATGISLGATSSFTDSAANVISLIAGGSSVLAISSGDALLKGDLTISNGTNAQVQLSDSDGSITAQGGISCASLSSSGAVSGTTGSFSSNVSVTGNLTVNGNTTIGNANTDTISFSARMATSLLPKDDTTQNLGGGSNRFNTVYASTFDGTALTAKYADLAENYLGDNTYEPGTVLVFGGANEVTTTTKKCDHRVAGVVSTNPAVTMNDELFGDFVNTVALQGRVPCKVLGKVEKGDLLVTSAIEGYAMVNNNPGIGQVIGKALQNKVDDGKGVIEVVVGRV